MTAIPTLPPGDCDETDSFAPAPLWPTPSACCANDGEGAATWPARRDRLEDKHIDGNGAGIPLAIAVQAPEECAPDRSTSSTAGRPANPLAQRVSALVRAIAGGAGPSSSESLANYNPAGYWQRIQPALFPCDTLEGSRPLDEYSTSFPRWGIVSATGSGRPVMSALRISASASSSWGDDWMTPIANDSFGKDHSPSLQEQRPARHAGRPLCIQVHEYAGAQELTPQARRVYESWATPRASCHDMDTLERSHYAGQRLKEMKQAGQPYRTKTSGMLSARWVCLLMALPPDYLDIPPRPGRAGRHARARRKGTTSPRG